MLAGLITIFHRGQQPTCSMPGLAAGLLGTIMTSTVPEQGLLHALSALVLVEPAGSSLTAGASGQPTAKGAACACSTEDGDRGLPRGLTGVAAVLFGSPWKLWPFAGRPKGDGVGPSPDCRLKLPLTCSLPAHRWDQLSWASCGAQCWRVRAFGTGRNEGLGCVLGHSQFDVRVSSWTLLGFSRPPPMCNVPAQTWE